MLTGESFAELRERSPSQTLDARDVAWVAAEVLDVLATAHERGVIHRDIKPGNIFRTQDGLIKVLDFGIARMRDAAKTFTPTRTGGTLGTPAFMPPEQALGFSKDIDDRTDLWALGATMFTLLSGLLVHEAETVEAMLVFTATRPVRSLAEVAPKPLLCCDAP